MSNTADSYGYLENRQSKWHRRRQQERRPFLTRLFSPGSTPSELIYHLNGLTDGPTDGRIWNCGIAEWVDESVDRYMPNEQTWMNGRYVHSAGPLD